MNIQVRKAQLKDVQPLLEIFSQANRYKLDRGDRSWDPGFSKKGVRWMIGLGTTYVALLDDTLVGTTALGWEDEAWDDDTGQAGYIHRLAVHASYHGQDLGKQILDWAASELKRQGRAYLRLDCNIANPKLCTYYEQLGFKRSTTKHFPDHNYTAALYERPV